MLYERLNSLMMLGRDGTSMVSVYITSVAIELRMARVFQADLGILSAFLKVDDEFSVEPVESDILLFLLTSSNFFSHLCVKIYSDLAFFSMMQKLLLSDLDCIAIFSCAFNLV
jgi:hypothetical protein